MRRMTIVAAVVLGCTFPGVASAHVELDPARAAAGSEKHLTLVVENERSNADTRRIDVQLPAGVSVEPVPPSAWTARASGRRLVYRTARQSAMISGDHVAKRFRLTATLPDRPRSTLTFKVLQTYDNGEVVRWIGSAGSEEPAAFLRLTSSRQQITTTGEGGSVAPPPAGNAEREGDDDGGGNGVTIAALIAVGVVGAGSLYWLLVRRRRA